MLQVSLFVCIGWVLSVCLHEFGHAIVAYWGGDTSVKDKGYLTLNPLKYTNINLSLLLPLLFLLIGGIALPGAAVYIDTRRLRNRWWQSAVSAAGPIASAIVTLFLALLFQVSLAYGDTNYGWISPALACLIFLQIFVIIINSLPIPSLDGYGVIEPWLPIKIQTRLNKISNQLLLFLFMLLLIVKPLSLFLGDLSTKIAESLGVPSPAILTGFRAFSQSSAILLIALIGLLFLFQRLTRKSHEVWYEKGKALMQAQKYEEAIAAFDKAIQNKPDYYEAWLEKGLIFDYLKKYEIAIVCFEKALKINPNYNLAWFGQAQVLENIQRFEDALESYRKVTQIAPANAFDWSLKGFALCKLERYKEAFVCCEKALQIHPNYHWALYSKACCYVRQNELTLALKFLRQVIKINPPLIKNYIQSESIFDPIREDPQFKQILET